MRKAFLAEFEQNDFSFSVITVDDVWINCENDECFCLNRSWVTVGGDGVTSISLNAVTNNNQISVK